MQKDINCLKVENSSSPNLTTIRFNKGPFIRVTVNWEGGSIRSSKLELSNAFECIDVDADLTEWIENYLSHNHSPFILPKTKSSFEHSVYQALNRTLFGSTLSYRQLAALCNSPKAARAVGNVCNKNPFPLFIPCHRVIHSNGKIGGFAMDIEIKKRLLEFEKG